VKIHEARPKPGHRRADRKRVGRGHGSGSGKTAGRGEKGAKSRSGFKNKKGFEGGQLPLIRRLPKRGFHNPFSTTWAEVNLDQLSRFEAGTVVDESALRDAGLLRGKFDKIVVLGRGEIENALTVRVHRVSRGATSKIEAAGGTVEVL
jgi:large subunit ribosomal protein L15